MDYLIGSISIAALIVGLVEFAKKFKLSGESLSILAFVLGVVLTGVAYGLEAGLIPPEAAPWIKLVVVALSGGPTAMGYYDLGKRFLAAS